VRTLKGLRKGWARPLVQRSVNPYLDMRLMQVGEQLNPVASGDLVVARKVFGSSSPLSAVRYE
jgi:hypothetical protein